MRRMILSTSLLFALIGVVHAGQIYKWVDAQGVTHFGEQPPAGQQSTTVNTAAPPPSSPPAAEAKPAPTFDSVADPQQAAIDAKVKQQVAAEEVERRKYCDTQRNNLAQLENNPRVRVEDKGQMRRLGEEERQQRISETRKAIEDNCK